MDPFIAYLLHIVSRELAVGSCSGKFAKAFGGSGIGDISFVPTGVPFIPVHLRDRWDI